MLSLLLLLLLNAVAAQEQPQCHIEGSCYSIDPITNLPINGELESTSENSYEDCLKVCQDNIECNWFTYYEELKDCYQFEDCPVIDAAGGGSPSFSGQTQCSEDDPGIQEPLCHISGQCTGLYIGHTEGKSYNDCLDACKNNVKCNWFTFFEQGEDNYCFHYQDCIPVEENSCPSCLTGQAECQPEEPCDNCGFCHGHIVAYYRHLPEFHCGNLCQMHENCGFYSYHSDSQFCLLTRDCIERDQTCDNCVIGERPPFPDWSFNKLMVIGGKGADNKVELVNLNDRVGDCLLAAVPNLPIGVTSAVGIYTSGLALVCGGSGGSGGATGPPTWSDKCYTYVSQTSQWVEMPPLMMSRGMAAATMVSPNTWWITGGKDASSHTLTSSEIISMGRNSFSIDLPRPMAAHCIVRIDDTHFMLIGRKLVYMIDMEDMQWVPIKDTIRTRYESMAGVVEMADGGKAVVVAGGKMSPKTSEIYDLAGPGPWKMGPELPVKLWGAATVQLETTFLLVGGLSTGGSLQRSIYMFDFNEEGEYYYWKEINQKLGEGRSHFNALMVPDDFVHCQ